MNTMETRHSTRQLRCIDAQGNVHHVAQALEEVRFLTVHGHWSDWGIRQELLMLGHQQIRRLSATELESDSPPQRLTLLEE